MRPLFLPLTVFSFAITVRCQTTESYYKKGLDEFNKQDYKGAIANFTLSLKERPGKAADAYFFRVCEGKGEVG